MLYKLRYFYAHAYLFYVVSTANTIICFYMIIYLLLFIFYCGQKNVIQKEIEKKWI